MASSLSPVHDAPPGRQRIATFALTSVCLFWGMTFSLMEVGVERVGAIQGTTARLAASSFFLLVRFALAAALTPLLIPRSVRRLDRAAWRHGFLLSLPFSLGFLLQLFGLTQADVSPSQSAFLTSLFAVATPVLDGIFRRRLPTRGVLLGLPLAMLGTAFIAGPPRGGLTLGAWVTIACAVVFAVHILVTDHSTRRADPLSLTLTTFVFTVGWMGLGLLLAPGCAEVLRPAGLLGLARDPWFLLAELGCAVLATVVAVSLLNRWQKELSPSRAAIVYTAEPIFATLISIAAGRERLSGWLFFGAAMILLANLAAALIGKQRPMAAVPAVARRAAPE